MKHHGKKLFCSECGKLIRGQVFRIERGHEEAFCSPHCRQKWLIADRDEAWKRIDAEDGFDDVDESMDGDFDTAMRDAGMGTDEDYGPGASEIL